LFMMSGSLFPFNMSQYSQGEGVSVDTATNHYFWFFLGGAYAITGLLLLYRRAQALRSVRCCPWLMLLLILACVSVFWSTAPELTLRRSIAFLGTNMVGLYLATRFSLQEVGELLVASFGLVIVCSLVLVL